MKRCHICLLFFLFLSTATFAQTGILKGVITDKVTGEALIGANIIYGPGMGTVTDINGEYMLTLEYGQYNITVSYVGYKSVEKQITIGTAYVTSDFKLTYITLTEVEVVGDLAESRETPVAFSNITPVKIEEQLGSRDIPLILNSTPGVYATSSGGGDGDARINIRGFSQRNVAVMLDGIPVNDMENGWVYWSNWFGLDAVMRGTQVQRGLGMSKLSIPSVGGTINITTKGIENKKNISIKQEVGTAGYLRTSLGLTTGRLKGGWGVTFAGSYKQGNGWVDQTWTKGWFYFIRVDKEFGKHLMSLTAMGAPQEHGQRSFKKYLSTFDTDYALQAGMTQGFIDTLSEQGLPTNMGTKYNPNWGYVSRAYITDTDTVYPTAEATSTASNFYHKPLFTLRDFWTVNEKVYISNVLYLSIGSGGGTSFSPTPSLDTATNQQNLQSKYNSNMNIPYGFNINKVSTGIMRNAVNNHFWIGLLSTVDYTINETFSFSGGVDLRTYKGEHYREIQDLFGGNYYLDKGNENQENDSVKYYVGDKIGYYDDALVRWAGLFSQLKYQNGSLTAFINLTGSVSGYKRIDYFIPENEDGSPNETPWKYIPGFTVKGGVNYNLNERMNVFMNLGFLSKAQRFQNVYDRQNQLYLDIQNERVKAIELGYSYVIPKMTLNINTYYTVWENKPTDRTTTFADPVDLETRYTVNINKMNALHTGIEFEVAYKITKDLVLESLLSLGDWRWTSNDSAIIYNDNGDYLGKLYFDARGLLVGDAAQFQNRESLRWEIINGLYASGVFTWFGKNYSEFNPLDLDPEESPWAFDSDGNPKQSWQMPNFFTLDFHTGYYWKIKKVGFQVRASILNVLDEVYVTDAQNNDPFLVHSSQFDANSAGVFMGIGRTFNIGLRLDL